MKHNCPSSINQYCRELFRAECTLTSTTPIHTIPALHIRILAHISPSMKNKKNITTDKKIDNYFSRPYVNVQVQMINPKNGQASTCHHIHLTSIKQGYIVRYEFVTLFTEPSIIKIPQEVHPKTMQFHFPEVYERPVYKIQATGPCFFQQVILSNNTIQFPTGKTHCSTKYTIQLA